MSENPRGPGRLAPIGTPETIRAVEALSAAAPNFSEVSGVVLRAIALSMQTDTPLSIPPLLFLGPPGIGKTFFSRSLAQALAVPYAELSMALSDDPGELVGHSLSWRGARPGLVARTLIEGWSVAPVLLVDEVEKTQWSNYGNPLDPFHSLLEPESARAFRDAYLDIPLRADRILWFFTANEIDTLRSSLIDRQLGDAQLDRAGSGLPVAIAVAVALGEAFGALFAISRAGQRTDLQLHQSLGGEADHLTQNVGVGGLLHERAKAHHVVGHRWFLGCVGGRNPILPANRR
jgi:hypothetical protein